jgi:hypothetical protein
MYQTLRLIVAATGIAFFSCPTSAPANMDTVQIKLTEKSVEDFIAAQRQVSTILEKMQGAVFSDATKSKLEAELDAVIRKHGFKNIAEYDLVSANISLVMAAIDPQTKAFSDPHTVIKKEIEKLRAEKTIPDREKKQLLAELNDALKTVPPIEFPANVELVKKHYDKIDVTISAGHESEGRLSSNAVRTISE